MTFKSFYYSKNKINKKSCNGYLEKKPRVVLLEDKFSTK